MNTLAFSLYIYISYEHLLQLPRRVIKKQNTLLEAVLIHFLETTNSRGNNIGVYILNVWYFNF